MPVKNGVLLQRCPENDTGIAALSGEARLDMDARTGCCMKKNCRSTQHEVLLFQAYVRHTTDNSALVNLSLFQHT